MSRYFFKIFLLLLCGLALTGCGDRHSEKPIITVSIPPQQTILSQITGDKYDIRCLLAGASDPESYDPSFTNLLNTEKSIAYLRMGNIGFEDAITDKIRNSSPDLPIIDTSKGVAPITGTHGTDDIDPHTWTSVANARIIAANMRDAMIDLDPDNKDYFEANYNRFAAHLDSLDNAIRAKLKSATTKAFAVWHPSLSYFARDYGLTQIIVGGVENKEISIPSLQANIEAARNSGVRIMFIQKESDSRQAESACELIGTTPVEISPLAFEWEDQMIKIAESIAGK